VPGRVIVGILLVKWIIWSVSLGSGTSGGVLALLLMRGGALGGLEAMPLPDEGVGFWPLISMGAILGGTMRSPFTGVIFAVVAYPDEPLRVVVYYMAETGFTRFPVVVRSNPHKLLGIISLSDLLKARTHHLEEEHRRERVVRIRLRFPLRSRRLHNAA